MQNIKNCIIEVYNDDFNKLEVIINDIKKQYECGMFTCKQYNRIADIVYEIESIINVNINDVKEGLSEIEEYREE